MSLRQTPTDTWLIECPCSRKARANSIKLWQVQRSGDGGSPRAAGSTKGSSAAPSGARSGQSPGRGQTPCVHVGGRRGAGAKVREDLVGHGPLRAERHDPHSAVAGRAHEGSTSKICCSNAVQRRVASAGASLGAGTIEGGTATASLADLPRMPRGRLPPAARRARPALLQASVLRSAKSHSRVSVDAEHWSADNARRLAVDLVSQKFPLPYFGIGDTASESAEQIYTARGIEVGVSVQQQVRGSWYATAGVRHVDQSIQPDTIGDLRLGLLPGSRGARVSEAIVGLIADSRDHILAPTAGNLLTLNVSRAARGSLSDFGYTRWRADARRYQSLTGEHVLAGQVLMLGVQGSAPFDQLAHVGGGDIMRGYARGRYRDRWMLAAQTEYRTPIRRRLGAVVFAGAGVVAPSAGDLMTDRVLLPSYGVGARFHLDARQRSAVRLDYGRGRNGASGLYIGFNQAF